MCIEIRFWPSIMGILSYFYSKTPHFEATTIPQGSSLPNACRIQTILWNLGLWNWTLMTVLLTLTEFYLLITWGICVPIVMAVWIILLWWEAYAYLAGHQVDICFPSKWLWIWLNGNWNITQYLYVVNRSISVIKGFWWVVGFLRISKCSFVVGLNFGLFPKVGKNTFHLPRSHLKRDLLPSWFGTETMCIF